MHAQCLACLPAPSCVSFMRRFACLKVNLERSRAKTKEAGEVYAKHHLI